MPVVVLTFAGGLLFWMSELSPVFGSYHNSQSELELARSGLQTMKQMVGDQQAWSKSIQEEYDKISAEQLVKIQPVNYQDYGDNFIGPNY